jgi:hypothetical protein
VKLSQCSKILSLTFFLTFFLYSCERELHVDASQYKDKLVLFSTFTSDSTINFHLSKTKSPYFSGTNNLDPDSAEIILIDDKFNELSFEYNSALEIINLKQKQISESSLSIVVKYPGLEDIFATCIFPDKVSIIEHADQLIKDKDNNEVLLHKIRLKTNKSEYLIIRNVITKRVRSLSGDTITLRDTAWLNSYSANIFSVLPSNTINAELYAKLNTDTETTIEFLSNDGFPKGNNFVDGNSVIELMCCDKNYYNYFTSSALAIWNSRFSNSTILSPVSVFSNVNNGMGVFGAYQIKKILKKY